MGGHGILATFAGRDPGPTIVFRCELDALPIEEANVFDHRSMRAGVSHKCGHDGHMAILLALASRLADDPPPRGRVVLLFQPAEETGEGAPRVVADARFSALSLDLILALHNLPGMPLGTVGWRTGVVSCGSVGLRARLVGRSAHAANPERGHSPLPALGRLVAEFPGIADGMPGFNCVTVTHLVAGPPAFGIAPGDATIHAVVRSDEDARFRALRERVEARFADVAARHGLRLELETSDAFPVGYNDARAVSVLAHAAARRGLPTVELTAPFLWSEDFACYGAVAPSALVVLGAGDIPPVHQADYDFPDTLIDLGARLFHEAARAVLGS